MRHYSEKELVKQLRDECKALGTQTMVAKRLKVGRAFLCDVLMGRRDVSLRLAKAMGYARLPIAYVKAKAKK